MEGRKEKILHERNPGQPARDQKDGVFDWADVGRFIERLNGSGFLTHGVAPCLVTCFSCSLISPRIFEMYKCPRLFIRQTTSCRDIPGSVQILIQMAFVPACHVMSSDLQLMPDRHVTGVKTTGSGTEGDPGKETWEENAC